MRRAVLHHLLLRLLLVAVFFNTAIGMPLHAVEHLQEVRAGAPADGAQDEPAEAHTVCAWCASHAQLEQALDAAAAPARRPRAAAGVGAPRRTVDAVSGADRWPFRSRDPPQA